MDMPGDTSEEPSTGRDVVDVIDVTEENADIFCMCLEDREEEAREAGKRRREWYEKMKGRGLGAKLAMVDGKVAGMIQYAPGDEVLLENGEGTFFINCVWVPAYNDDRGSFQGKGVGKALLAAAEKDARERGAKSMTAWGLRIPVWMKAAWFKKQGYRKVHTSGIAALMWKPFEEGLQTPRFVPPRRKPDLIPGKVKLSVVAKGWCRASNMAIDRAIRIAHEFGDSVIIEEVDTTDLSVALEWGGNDTLWVDQKEISTGPPPSEEKIRSIIAKRVKRLK